MGITKQLGIVLGEEFDSRWKWGKRSWCKAGEMMDMI
jgi:hypothetical protein